MKLFKQSVTVAITGASGMPYAFRLLQCLIDLDIQIMLLVSKAAFDVIQTEMGWNIPNESTALYAWFQNKLNAKSEQLQLFGHQEWTACVASGSGAPDAMIVCPASMGTVSAIAIGASNNLIERAADVMLKEKKQLILVPRETPYSVIHLENLLQLAKLGVTIMPASPGFYYQPTKMTELVDFLVARILQHLHLKQTLIKPWGMASNV
ncbi:MAG: UbiX family flavin prenyltransferase [Endozoicomonadaceae bacterium]|nr:UbiX family flavin prenyltransferase [Endozoicomonadaceae bacterium]MBE8232675.1 UbiX family flavin prenyltransferase [Endozoicomonadaceae bacterium]